MEQNKPTPIAVSTVKPAAPASVAPVRPVTPATVAPVAAKPVAAAPAKPVAKKAKPAKRKPAQKAAAAKKTAVAKKPVAKKPAAKKARKPIARKAVAAKKTIAKKAAPSAAKQTTKSPSWSFGAAKAPFAAAKAPKFSSESFMPFGADAMKTLFGPAAQEMQQMSEKAFGFGKDGADQFAKSADAAARSLNEAVAISQDNMEACVESGNIAAEFSKTVGEEVFEFSNNLFAKNVELSKKVFACRTINDMFDLQSKVFKANIDGVFNEAAKISEMTFKMASKASEPLNERAAAASKRLRKAFSA